MDLKPEYIDCACHSPEHTLRFTYNLEDKEIYTEVQLNNTKNFLQRIIAAVKYIFGYQSKYGHWDCTILNPQEVDRLLNLLIEFRRGTNHEHFDGTTESTES